MKRERLTARDITILVSVILLAICCICVGTILTTIEDIGLWITAPLRWFQNLTGSSEPDLREALQSSRESTFLLNSRCTFPYTSGSRVSSEGEPRQTELSREQVIEHFETYFDREYFLVQQGEVRLNSGVPVQVSEIAQGSFYLSLLDEQHMDGLTSTTTLDGVVDNNIFVGSYYATETESAVRQGQGIENALTLTADLQCPLTWDR
jgi:hypothetical protein